MTIQYWPVMFDPACVDDDADSAGTDAMVDRQNLVLTEARKVMEQPVENSGMKIADQQSRDVFRSSFLEISNRADQVRGVF
jgi:hypothetical protein